MFGDCETVGHAGDIVGDRAGAGRPSSAFAAHSAGIVDGSVEIAPRTAAARSRPPCRGPRAPQMAVHPGEQERLDVAVGCFDRRRKADQRCRPAARDRLGALDARCGDAPRALAIASSMKRVMTRRRELVDDARLLEPRMEIVDLAEAARRRTERRRGARRSKQARAQAVVDVMGVVSDVVGDRGRLRLEAGMAARSRDCDVHRSEGWRPERRARGTARRARPTASIKRAVVLDQPLQGLLGRG